MNKSIPNKKAATETKVNAARACLMRILLDRSSVYGRSRGDGHGICGGTVLNPSARQPTCNHQHLIGSDGDDILETSITGQGILFVVFLIRWSVVI